MILYLYLSDYMLFRYPIIFIHDIILIILLFNYKFCEAADVIPIVIRSYIIV